MEINPVQSRATESHGFRTLDPDALAKLIGNKLDRLDPPPKENIQKNVEIASHLDCSLGKTAQNFKSLISFLEETPLYAGVGLLALSRGENVPAQLHQFRQPQ